MPAGIRLIRLGYYPALLVLIITLSGIPAECLHDCVAVRVQQRSQYSKSQTAGCHQLSACSILAPKLALSKRLQARLGRILSRQGHRDEDGDGGRGVSGGVLV